MKINTIALGLKNTGSRNTEYPLDSFLPMFTVHRESFELGYFLYTWL